MNWKKILSILILISSTTLIFAQNDADVLRYGLLNYGSTARSLAMGNSFGALGADFSCLSSNPGGIGLFRHSEFTVSPLFSNRTNDTKFNDAAKRDNYFKFAFGNFGAVFVGESEKSIHFKSWAFGLGYNKLNDFSGRSKSSTINSTSSLIDNYIEQLNYDVTTPENISNTNAYAFDINLAWQTFLIDTINPNNQFHYFNNAATHAGEQQTRTVTTQGGQGEWDFSFGTNYDNKLFLGATFGLNTVHYEENVTWKEEDIAGTIPNFNSFTLNTRLKTTGSGINLKIGAIYKPNDIVRIGLAIHSPTYFTLSDDYSTVMVSDLENGNVYQANSPVFIPFDYNITTPYKAIGSLGLIVARTAALNIEYEYLDYNQGRLSESDPNVDANFNSINRGIKSKYTSSHSIKLGCEYKFENLRFRVGANYSTSPFKKEFRNDTQSDLSRYGTSCGFGIKQENYFVDFAYAYSVSGSYFQPYTLSSKDVPIITTKQYDNRFLITFGYNF